MAALLCGVHVLAGAAEPMSLVNRAGEQRMLSQRVVKFYGQLGLGVVPAQSRAGLADSMRRFETNLDVLGPEAARAPDTAQAFDRLALAWKPIRAAASRPPTPESAQALARLAEDVLAAAEWLTRTMENASGRPISQAINIAGRQRMLSQRVAKAYMLRSWGVDASSASAQMGTAVQEFGAALALLMARPENTDEIRGELQDLELQWDWLRSAVSAEGATSYPLIVAEASEAILVSTNRITRLYDRFARR